MTIQTAQNFFVWKLSEQREAVQAMLQILPQRIRECSGEEKARDAFTEAERTTKQQAQNIDRCFQPFGGQPAPVQSHIIRCFAEDHDAFITQSPPPQATVLFDLGELDRMRAYTISAYNDLVEQAKLLDQSEVVKLLKENLTQDEAIAAQVRPMSQQIRKQWVKQPATAGAARG